MSVISDVLDDVVSTINAGSLGVTAEKKYIPQLKLSEVVTSDQVFVTPGDTAYINHTRSSTRREVQILVIVMSKTADNGDVEAALDLVEDIAGLFDRDTSMPASSALWGNAENDPVYLRSNMEEMRQFTSVLTLTFNV